MKRSQSIWKSLGRKIARSGIFALQDAHSKLEQRVAAQGHTLERLRRKAENRDTAIQIGQPAQGLETIIHKTLKTLKQRLERFPKSGSARKILPTWTTLEDVKSIPEEDLFRLVLELRKAGSKTEAIHLLETRVSDSEQPQLVRTFQASLAYEKGLDDNAVDFLNEAIDLTPSKRDTLFWGPTAIISNSCWSKAMNAAGKKSQSFMWDYAHINRREDFDLFVEDLVPDWADPESYREDKNSLGALMCFLSFLHLVEFASVVHLPMTGSFLGNLRIWKAEADLLKRAGIKIVAMPYGGDYYCYSTVMDPCVRYGLLVNYPQLALKEPLTKAKVEYWQREADCVLAGYMLDAMGRWDVTIFTFFHINTNQWKPKNQASGFDGRNGLVKILHTPNHRGFKGTEFLVNAVKRLKEKGLQVELVLLEKVPNDKVCEIMRECDILGEQFIANAYALSGIEGMASGLPVLANLENEYYTRVYRRYSFLNECPILSTTPETLERNLEILVTNPELRNELGQAGRSYVEKYHSYPAAQYLFGKIYERILEDKEVDLMNLYHPLLSESAASMPPIKHPLVENKLPRQSAYLKS